MFPVRPPKINLRYNARYRRGIPEEYLVFGQKFLEMRKAWWNILICIL